LIEDTVFAPWGAAEDESAPGGGQHRDHGVAEDLFIVLEEGGLVEDHQVGSVAAYGVGAVGQGYDPAPVSVVDTCPGAAFYQGFFDLFGHIAE